MASSGGPPDGDPDPEDGGGGGNDADEEARRREEENRRRAAFLDSLARGGARAGSAGQPGEGKHHKSEVQTLKDAAVHRVSAMLTDPALPAAALGDLKHVTVPLADAILANLIAEKKLDVHSLRRLASRVTLETATMDAYRLATDSLLAILGTTSLRKLSLRGCTYITDDGIRSLAPLARTLEFLDLSNCKATDKACPTIAGMRAAFWSAEPASRSAPPARITVDR